MEYWDTILVTYVNIGIQHLTKLVVKLGSELSLEGIQHLELVRDTASY